MKKGKLSKIILILIAVGLLGFNAWCEENSVILQKIKDAQPKFKDYQAQVEVKTISPMFKSALIQTQKIYRKAPDKERIEVLSPTKITTILNGKKIYQIDESGKALEQDLEVLSKSIAGNYAAPDKITNSLDQYDLTISQNESQIIITGIPKQLDSQSIISKLVLVFDQTNLMLRRIEVYQAQKLLMSSDLQYVSVGPNWLLSRLQTEIKATGMNLTITSTYKDVQVDQDLPDSLFEVTL